MPKPRIMKRHKKTAKKSNVAKIARNIVKKELAKNLEDKYQILHYDQGGDYVGDITDATQSNNPYWVPLPGMAQGTGVSNRIGNELIPKSHKINGYVYFNNDVQEAFSCAQLTYVKIYIGLVRATNNLVNSGSNPLKADQLLWDVNGTTTDFKAFNTGLLQFPLNYATLKMNPYYFKPVKTLTILLGKNYGLLNTTADNYNPITGKYNMGQSFNVDLSKHLPSKFIYTNDGDLLPQNYVPVIYCVAYNALNGNLVSSPQILMKTILKYTDA